MNRPEDIRQKLTDWQDRTASYLQEIKSLIYQMKEEDHFQVISYFTYSLNILHQQGHENYSLGSFHIQNLGTTPLTNPHICIKVSPDSLFNFSGKYVYKDSQPNMGLTDAWERFNDAADQQEYWLRPLEKSVLNPTETLTFSNFQVRWLPESSYAGSIMGFVYGDEIQDGINALNHMNVSGTIYEEDENE